MIKVKKGEYVYYYRDNVAEVMLNDYVNGRNNDSHYYHIGMADIVINTKTNEILKCRWLVEDLVDKIVK